MASQMLTPARLAWVLAVGESTVAHWLAVKPGKPPAIAHFRQGRLIRISPAAVLEFIARNSVQARGGSMANVTGGKRPAGELDWSRIQRLIADQVAARLKELETN